MAQSTACITKPPQHSMMMRPQHASQCSMQRQHSMRAQHDMRHSRSVQCRVSAPPSPSDAKGAPVKPPPVDPADLPLPPGTEGLPFIGETLDYMKHVTTVPFLQARKEKYGSSIFRTKIFGTNVVCVLDPKLVRKVLSGEYTIVQNQPIESLNYLFGIENMQNQYGANHMALKRAFVDGLNDKVIPLFYPVMERVIDGTIQQWEASGDDVIEISNHTRTITLQIGASVSLGYEFDGDAIAYMAPLWRVITGGVVAGSDFNLPWTRKGKALKAKAEIERFFQKYVDDIYATMRDVADDGSAAGSGCSAAAEERRLQRQRIEAAPMWTLMNLKKPDGTFMLNQEKGPETMLMLLFGAHETTSWALDMCAYTLACFPHVADRIHEEQMRVVAAHGEAFTPAAVADMKYTEAVLKEIFRWTAANPTPPRMGLSLFRTALKDFELGGYRVPKGWSVFVDLVEPMKYVMAVDGTEAEFNPERWFAVMQSHSGRSLTDAMLPAEYTYPFSSGPRRCPGAPLAWAEMRVFVAKLARKYKLTLAADDEPWRINLDNGDLFPRPQLGLPCRLHRR